MTRTRQLRHKNAFLMGDLWDSDGTLIKVDMPKWEARLFFRSLDKEDAKEKGFIWLYIVDEYTQDELTWEKVHGS